MEKIHIDEYIVYNNCVWGRNIMVSQHYCKHKDKSESPNIMRVENCDWAPSCDCAKFNKEKKKLGYLK